MAFELDNFTGDIVCRQGDSGSLTLSGIPQDRDYTVYWAGRDSKNNIVLEMEATPVDGDVTFKFLPTDTEQFTVPSGMKSKTYYWGVKICCIEDGYEDTVVIGINKTIASLNKFIVYPKIVEGTL